MKPSLAASITRHASRQTYYTIRTLVDASRREDAYRAYGYFRWVDDRLDAESDPKANIATERVERLRFLDREQALLDACLRGGSPAVSDPHEAMLVELACRGHCRQPGIESYLRNMMRVMAFDARRRGRLVTAAELDAYTGWLATAVTDAVSSFVAGGVPAEDDADRYRAAEGAHVLHMLRDTVADARLGYYNIPRERLDGSGSGPGDVDSSTYRAWVRERVHIARADFDAGRAYLARCRCRRERLAGLSYIARFEWLIEQLERDGFRVRAAYDDLAGVGTKVRMGRRTAEWMLAGSGAGR